MRGIFYPYCNRRADIQEKQQTVVSLHQEVDEISIPIVIGVTGHRDLLKQEIPELKNLVAAELQKIITGYPNTPIVMLNALASGADLLCAEIALGLGIKLKCVLPMELALYRKDFSGDDAVQLDQVISKAEEVFTAPLLLEGSDFFKASYPLEGPTASKRDFCYRQAGIYVAQHSHVLIALWDGSPAEPVGCGTSETLGFIRPTAELFENDRGGLEEMLCMTDLFNRDATSLPDGEMSDLVEPELLKRAGGQAKTFHLLFQKADALSLQFQRRYLFVMRLLSAFGVGLVLAFLLYDELESDFFLPIYGLLLILSASLLVLARKGSYHTKYLQYRVLAEALRTQFFLVAAGIERNIGEAFTWTQKQESLWIKAAVSGLLIGPTSSSGVPEQEIKAAWIDGQLDYHKKASGRVVNKIKLNDNTTLLMLVLSVVLFLVVFALEFLYQSIMTQQIPFPDPKQILLTHEGQGIIIRSVLKIVLGGISAVTVFLANYYGKMSLDRKAADHKKMAALYKAAREKYDEGNIPKDKLFWELAREEIIENGNWYSYCQHDAPSIIL